MKHFPRLALVLLLVVVCAGARCSRSGKATVPARPLTKAEYFKEKQAATMTPHGAIDMTSVTETADGVEYTTTDGNRWHVVLEPTPGGGWRVRGDPEPVK
jgi:hypothetical protein